MGLLKSCGLINSEAPNSVAFVNSSLTGYRAAVNKYYFQYKENRKGMMIRGDISVFKGISALLDDQSSFQHS